MTWLAKAGAMPRVRRQALTMPGVVICAPAGTNMGSLGLRKEPNSLNQYALVSSEGIMRMKGQNLKIIISCSSTPLRTTGVKGRTCK